MDEVLFVCVSEECVLEDCEMKQIVVVCCDFVELCDRSLPLCM